MNYRGYFIEPSSWLPGKYEFHKGEGDKVNTADSESEAKRLIDQIIFESTVWEVKIPHAHPLKCTWLTEALELCNKHNGVLRPNFNAI